MKTYEPLATRRLEPTNQLCVPEHLPELVHLDDPALSVMVNFKYLHPITIHAGEFIDKALNEMKISGVHLLIVIDDDNHVVGLIGSEDLLGDKPLRIMQMRNLPRNEIRVRLVMTPQTEIFVLDIDELKHAKVAHIVETLRTLKAHYMLVIENHDSNQQHVIGLFSSSQISKQLHLDLTAALNSSSYSIPELQKKTKE